MPYLWKFSRRLAAMFSIMPVFIAGLIACQEPVSSVDALSPEVASNGSAGFTSGPGLNQPSGFTPVFDNPLSDQLTGAFNRYGFKIWPGDSARQLVRAVQDGQARGVFRDYYEHTIPRGMPGGWSAARYAAGSSFPRNTGHLYVRQVVRLRDGYTTNGNAGTKFWFPRASGDTAGNNHTSFYNGTTARTVRLHYSPQNDGLTSSFYGDLYEMTIGDWHELEWLLEPNTPGIPNGRIRAWVDGRLALDGRDVGHFDRHMRPEWSYLWVDIVYGFGTNAAPDYDMHWDVASWYASVK
jgi:hypothetical protein